jgi:predicted transcriptional regulator
MGYFDSIYSADLPHRAVAVYMYLKSRANKDGTCWPAVRTIARELHLSRATVQRALRELQSSGWLVKENRYRDNGSSTSNLYRIK